LAFFEASNRGHRSLATTFSQPFRAKMSPDEAQYGDGTLFKDGFTLVWVGWQKQRGSAKPGLVGNRFSPSPWTTRQAGQPGRVNTFGFGAPWIVAKDSPTLELDNEYQALYAGGNDPRCSSVAVGGFDKPKVISGAPTGNSRPDGKSIYPQGRLQGGRVPL